MTQLGVAVVVVFILGSACVANGARPADTHQRTEKSPAKDVGGGVQETTFSAASAGTPTFDPSDRDLDVEIGALGDSKSVLAEQAVRRLESRGHAVVPQLLRALDADRLGGVGRARILTILARIGAPEALPVTLAAMNDRRSIVSAAAIDAVSTYPDPRATVELVRLLDDRDPDVVKQAALRLGEKRAVEAVPKLGALLESPSQGVRFSAALALQRVGTPEARARLRDRLVRETDPEVRDLLMTTLSAKR